MRKDIKVEKRIHEGYKEFEKCKEKGLKIRQMLGKYQYIYSSNKGEISLIYLPNYFPNQSFWEIYSLKGNLFKDVERFDTKKEAEKRIEKLLTPQNI